jgi:hypothetical protein
MADWITTGERPALPIYLSPFAKSASGSSSNDDDEDDGDDEDDEDDDEDDDPDAEKSDEELRAELKATRLSLKKANDQSARRRRRERERRAAEDAKKPAPKKPAEDDDKADLDVIRREALAEGEKVGIVRAKKAEAKSALLAAGVNPTRVARAVGLVDLDDLDLDDDGLDGIDTAIEDLKKDWPELFAKPRQKRQSVAGDRDRDGDRPARGKGKSASELAAAKLLGR